MTYLALETSTHDGQPVELYRFTFGNGSFFYTSADRALERDGARYTPEAITRTEIEHNIEDTSGTITVTLPSANPVARLFQAYLPSSPVALEIYRVHRDDGQFVLAYAGDVTAVEFEDSACRLTCLPVSGRLGRQIPARLFQSQCNHTLFSETVAYGGAAWNPRSAQTVGCNVKRAAHRTEVTVSSLTGVMLSGAAFASKPDGYFTGGMIELSNGEKRYLVGHTGTTVELAYPAPVTTGEVVVAFPGCDGSEETCKSKFNNIINFSGFTRVPTRNPYEGGIGV